jgi:hypothetical protein
MKFGEPHLYPERGSPTDGASRGNKVRKGDRVDYLLASAMLIFLCRWDFLWLR